VLLGTQIVAVFSKLLASTFSTVATTTLEALFFLVVVLSYNNAKVRQLHIA
jgi:hypothetical protein